MTHDQFIWQPYTPTVLQYLPDICYSQPNEWDVITSMIFFEIVDWHRPDRVVRQFGLRQEIPGPCDTLVKLHKIDKRGNPEKSWPVEHSAYINLWNGRSNIRVVGLPIDDDATDYNDPYMIWYRQHTRLVISPLQRQQSASFQSSAPPLHVLSKFIAKWNTRFNVEIASMPLEVPPHYQTLLTDYASESSRCLEETGFGHLLQPIQELHLGDYQGEVRDDSPLPQFNRRQQRTCTLSPVLEEEETPQSSRGK